ncbi:MAG: HAMP domain-containing histidine kinase [Planctomycetaceae bacterium]|nr:HAMP domain-containing histidine kinase [Planctomycetaceae bacterium]
MGKPEKKQPFWSLLTPELADAFARQYRADLEREKIDALAEFAAGAGHELNNPLAIIGGRTQLLMREISDPEHQKYLASILSQVKRAYEMIADIRLFARPPVPVPRETDVVELLRSVIGRYQEITSGMSISWQVNIPFQEMTLLVDPSMLQTVFSILCKNSIEAVRQNGSIILTCGQQEIGNPSKPEKREVALIVTFEDDGCGITPEQMPHLFSPYFSGRQAGRGLGFGLPKAWRLLQQMGGGIEAKNRIPQGAKFILTIRSMERGE